jgi:hypothetical protein
MEIKMLAFSCGCKIGRDLTSLLGATMSDESSSQTAVHQSNYRDYKGLTLSLAGGNSWGASLSNSRVNFAVGTWRRPEAVKMACSEVTLLFSMGLRGIFRAEQWPTKCRQNEVRELLDHLLSPFWAGSPREADLSAWVVVNHIFVVQLLASSIAPDQGPANRVA